MRKICQHSTPTYQENCKSCDIKFHWKFQTTHVHLTSVWLHKNIPGDFVLKNVESYYARIHISSNNIKIQFYIFLCKLKNPFLFLLQEPSILTSRGFQLLFRIVTPQREPVTSQVGPRIIVKPWYCDNCMNLWRFILVGTSESGNKTWCAQCVDQIVK